MSATALARVDVLPHDPVDPYVDATFERFQRAVVATAPRLVEPRVADPDRARRRLAALVETLAGVAVGTAVGQVATAARRTLGTNAGALIDAELARIVAHGRDAAGAPRVASALDAPDPDGPLVRVLVARSWPRLCTAVGIARTRVRRLATVLAATTPDAERTLARLLVTLADDDASALAFADHVELGWATYAAIVAGRPRPTAPPGPRYARCAATWRAWAHELTGHVAARVPGVTRGELGRGAIVRIA